MRRWWSLVVSVLLVLSAVGPASAAPATAMPAASADDALAKSSVAWTPATSGPSLIWDATAFAPTTGQLVQFGGTTAYQTPTTTRLFNPATGVWTTIAAQRRGSPAARSQSALAWDPVHRKVVLFGGISGGATLSDTWTFDPGTRVWAQVAMRGKAGTDYPLPRRGHALVWSSALARILLFGGMHASPSGISYNDVWVFDGTSWTKLVTTNTPAARSFFGMAEDPTTGRVVMFGGVDSQLLFPDLATWVLNPATRAWARVATATVPQPKAFVGMTWLGSVGAVVLATGDPNQQDNGYTNSVWAFDAGAGDWRQLTAFGGTPTPRMSASLTASPADGSAILIGGAADQYLPPTLADRTWILR